MCNHTDLYVPDPLSTRSDHIKLNRNLAREGEFECPADASQMGIPLTMGQAGRVLADPRDCLAESYLDMK